MSTTAQALLPEEFADLEPFAEWSIQRDHERYQKRLASSMQELQALYDAVAPRAPDAMVYLEQFELEDMPEPALRLLWLLYSLITISFAVDIFKQPSVPDSGVAYLEVTVEPPY